MVVIGAGTLGLMTLQAYRATKARRVVVLDTAPNRLEVARQLGAYAIVNPAIDDAVAVARAAFGGAAPAVVIDAVGRTVTRHQAVELVVPGGTVVLLGLAEVESNLDMLGVINREVRLQGSYGSRDKDVRDAITLIAGEHADVTSWVDTFTLERGQEIFTRLVTDPSRLVKALFVVNGRHESTNQ